MIVGDFNCKEIDWDTRIVNAGPGHFSQCLMDCINDLFLDQQIVEPTRYRDGENSNTLDWILTDLPECIVDICLGPPLGAKGDHCTISFNLIFPKRQTVL